ncbi:Uu.00g086870.m01.CDS01 [Anthostomella pinea]|uniref:Uu.00g086870.m01.CDS01 n=1 Tax=Anthostomella pinea TaxID=933095 RepID=A0AAI8YJT8_9PEZI|nr:Uu.00g086870.m01.CDS01 [Anthostomella pinea]
MALLSGVATIRGAAAMPGFFETLVTAQNGSTVSVFIRNTTHSDAPPASASTDGGDKFFWASYVPRKTSGSICGDSTIMDAGCELNAAVPDCQAIIDGLGAKPGMWEFGDWSRYSGEYFHTLSISGDCAWGVSIVKSTWTAIDIASQDIYETVTSSWKHAKGGRVGTYGQMICGAGTSPPSLVWAMYTPSRFPQ